MAHPANHRPVDGNVTDPVNAGLLGDVNGTAADDRTAARAGAKFSQGHPNRHSGLLFFYVVALPTFRGFAPRTGTSY